MTEHDDFGASPEDALLDKQLLGLQHFAPHPGFADRVLARVARPGPALVRVRSRARSFVTPKRLWWTSGVAAAGSTAWILAVTSWLSGARLAAAGAWLNAEVGAPLSSAALQGATAAANGILYYVLAAYSALGDAIFPTVAATMIAPVLS